MGKTRVVVGGQAEVYADSSTVADGRAQRAAGQCRKVLCVRKAEQLAAEQKAHAATKRALETERATRATIVKGEVRAQLLGREAEAEQLDVLRHEAKDLLTDRNWFQRRALLLQTEVSQLLDAGALLAADLAAASTELKRKAKDAVTSARRNNGLLQGARSQTAAANRRTDAAVVRAEDATTQWAEVEVRLEELEAAVLAAEARATEAQLEATCWRDDALEEGESRRLAEEASVAAEAGAEHRAALEIEEVRRRAQYDIMLADRQATRAKERAARLAERLGQCIAPHEDRTADAWAALSREAKRKAVYRRRAYLKGIFTSHEWCMADVAHVLAGLGHLDKLFNTPEVFGKHFDCVAALVKRMEQEQFGIPFGLYLHCDMHLTHDKILQLVQAGCQKYTKSADRYKAAPLLYNPFVKGAVVNFPRIAPPRSKLEPVIRKIEAETGVQSAENGRLAFRSLQVVVQELIARDCGVRGSALPSNHSTHHRPLLPDVTCSQNESLPP